MFFDHPHVSLLAAVQNIHKISKRMFSKGQNLRYFSMTFLTLTFSSYGDAGPISFLTGICIYAILELTLTIDDIFRCTFTTRRQNPN